MPIGVTRSPGLRKFITQPKPYAERYGNFTLTNRDYEILDIIYRYRYLEARHIRALVHGSDQQITRRLQGLFHNGYVGRYTSRLRMRTSLNPGAPLMAYGLELRGARALQAHPVHCVATGIGEHELLRWNKAYTRRTEWFLEHSVMISNFHCVLKLATRRFPGVKLVTWEQGIGKKGTICSSGQRGPAVRISPDAYFALHEQGALRHFFLEVDRSTEEHDKIVRKYSGYWQYLQTTEYVTRHEQHRRVNVLFVTTGEQRLRNLTKKLRQFEEPYRARHAGKSLFWFCLDRHVSLENPTTVLRPVWRNAQGSAKALAPNNPCWWSGQATDASEII